MEKPDEIPTEEVRDFFLKTIINSIEYWDQEGYSTSTKGKLLGLARDILSLLDGKNSASLSFIVAPNPHPDAKYTSVSSGKQRFYSENYLSDVKGDISGGLTELFKFYIKNQVR